MTATMSKLYVFEKNAPPEIVDFLDQWRKERSLTRKSAIMLILHEKMEEYSELQKKKKKVLEATRLESGT